MNKEILIKEGYELLEKDDLDELKEKLKEWKIQISNSEDALPVKCIEQCCHQLTFILSRRGLWIPVWKKPWICSMISGIC